MAISSDKARLVANIEKTLELKLIKIAKEEKRSKSSMTGILIEEAIKIREQQNKK